MECYEEQEEEQVAAVAVNGFWLKAMVTTCLAVLMLSIPAAFTVANKLGSIDARLDSLDSRVARIERKIEQ